MGHTLFIRIFVPRYLKVKLLEVADVNILRTETTSYLQLHLVCNCKCRNKHRYR